jgi:hypothetical protein
MTSAEGRGRTAEVDGGSAIEDRAPRHPLSSIAYPLSRFFLPSALCLLGSAVSAQPTQQEVFQSINKNVGDSVDPVKMLAFVLCVVATIILLCIVGHRRNRKVTPKPLNHPGKLLKEVARSMNLKPAEVRQLKVLAEGQDVSSPLVLLLCPSLLSKAVKEQGGKGDRRALVGVAKKVGARDT